MDRNQQLNQEFFLEYFKQSEKPSSQWALGLEQELIGIWTDQRRRLSFPEAVEGLLASFAEQYGWQGYLEGGRQVGLKKDGSSVTIEPGSQLELSCAPFKSLGEIENLLKTYQSQLQALSQGKGWTWLSIGYDPFQIPEEIEWVPKKRYQVMGEYLPTLGKGALHMMKTTCTAQSNFDYASEADMVLKMRAATAFAPFLNILFATSPFTQGQLADCKSRRGWAWRHMSPQHSGFLDFVFDDDFGYQRYIDYILDVPMLVLERDGEIFDFHGFDFKTYIKEGFGSLQPAADDWKVHLGATFPVARLRNAIETRTCDAGPMSLLLGQAALWKGILYDQQSLDWANDQIDKLGLAYFKTLHEKSYCSGFDYLKNQRDAEQLMGDFIEVSKAGLERQGLGESHYLEPVEQIFSQRQSIADLLILGFHTGQSFEEMFKKQQIVFAEG